MKIDNKKAPATGAKTCYLLLDNILAYTKDKSNEVVAHSIKQLEVLEVLNIYMKTRDSRHFTKKEVAETLGMTPAQVRNCLFALKDKRVIGYQYFADTKTYYINFVKLCDLGMGIDCKDCLFYGKGCTGDGE